MSSQSKKVQEWRNRTKENLIKAMGSKCAKCNYSTTNSALEFHHLDPNQKNDTVSNMFRNPRKIESIIDEAKKCVLLCANCHRELHDKLWDIQSIVIPVFNESIFRKPIKSSYKCKNCGKETFNKFFCSRKCTGLGTANHKIDWPSTDQLIKMVNEASYVKVGELLGVSDNAVRKRIKNH